MKKLNFLVFFCLVSIGLMAQGSDGVIFKKDDWSAILAQAKAEDKLIFVDAFTTWCGPCKKMDRDVEKGQGIKLARDYNVSAFPTFLFIDGMVHTMILHWNILKHKKIGEQKKIKNFFLRIS